MAQHSKEQNIDFIGIGTSKSGTNWIRTCLQEHPEIHMPVEIALKYFDGDLYEPSLSLFWKKFSEAPNGCIIGEYTPRYYCSKEAITRIANHLPKTKIIAVLRNPVARTISQYRYKILYEGKEREIVFKQALTGPFAWEYVDKSCYYKHLEVVFDHFQSSKIHIVLYEEIRTNPKKVLRNLYSFLGVNEDFVPPSIESKVNPTPKKFSLFKPNPKMRRLSTNLTAQNLGQYLKELYRLSKVRLKNLPNWLARPNSDELVITEEDKKMLYDQYFGKDIAALESLTGMDFSVWKEPYA